jgi:DNA-binding MarR family transcriptional regulator
MTTRSENTALQHPRVGLAFLVSQLGAYAAHAFARHLEPLDLTPQHVGILRLLAMKPQQLTQTELASRLGVQPSRLVVLLDEIEKRGLLTREPNPDDRRSNFLRATAAGLKKFKAAESATLTLEEEMFADLSAAKRAGLIQTLEQLTRRLGLLPGSHPAYRNHREE